MIISEIYDAATSKFMEIISPLVVPNIAMLETTIF
jgi:hypothetical protein